VNVVAWLARAVGAPATSKVPAAVGRDAVPYLDARSAIGLSAVWRCVTLIADTIADMPWTEWKGDALLESSRLVRRPMATMTRRTWTWRMVATEALFNTAYCLHVGGRDTDGTPWSLLPLPPVTIRPYNADPWGLTDPYEYMVAGFSKPVSVDDLTIVRRAPFPGISEDLNSILELARRQFTAFVAADVHMARYWQAGGPTTTQITSDQELDDAEAAKMGERWVERRSLGTEYPAVFGKGAKAEPWGADPTSESAVEARADMTAQAGRYFGVPTRILNAPAGDSETYSNVENDAVDLLRYTLRGYMGPIEDAISTRLPGDYIGGRRMEFDPARFLQGTLTDRAAAWVSLTTGDRPIADLDEARVRGFGLPARPQPELTAPATPATVTVTETVPAVAEV